MDLLVNNLDIIKLSGQSKGHAACKIYISDCRYDKLKF